MWLNRVASDLPVRPFQIPLMFSKFSNYINVCMYLCMYVCNVYMYVCIYTYVHTYIIDIHTCMHRCIHTYILTCMYIYIRMYESAELPIVCQVSLKLK